MTAAPAEAAVAKSAVAVKGQCDKQTALNLTRQIQGLVKQSWELIKEAFNRRAWAALGYDSWETYCRRELGSGVRRLSKELRSEAVAELTNGDRPMSNRAIASALGVAEGTVRADLQAGAQNYAPEPEPAAEENDGDNPDAIDAEVIDAEVIGDQPEPQRKVIGADGKTYRPMPRDVPPPSRRRRRPLPEAFGAATEDLDKVMQRIVRLTADDRFPVHAAALNTGSCRGDLDRVQQSLQRVLDALSDAGVQPQVDARLADGGDA